MKNEIPEEIKNFIKDYLKDNLKIKIEEEAQVCNYGSSEEPTGVTVKLFLDGKEIDASTEYIS
jgi:hypothetical protein